MPPEELDLQYLAFVQERFHVLEAMWDSMCRLKVVKATETVDGQDRHFPTFQPAKSTESVVYTQLVETAEAVELEPLWAEPGTVEVQEDGTLTLKEGFLDRSEGRWLLEVGNARLGVWFVYQQTMIDPKLLKKITLIGTHFAGKAMEAPASVLQMVQQVMGYTDQAEAFGDRKKGYLYIVEDQSADALRLRTQL